ncbi:hypothetical protein IFT73_01005 [Aeromicrobium sp. CFBP 8757]|uniref:hypothetical protein n=1 Tax=Aeromicrobium sp. CFBP 8757 TaxID=2775288 RepID=UPI00177DCE21|nr:hypothetical protein [Aeromicrobium sp. CFBP 8757]MBD8605417.1 hypothetical protein [Aeromicrobium sp. CFBP 8757]
MPRERTGTLVRCLFAQRLAWLMLAAARTLASTHGIELCEMMAAHSILGRFGDRPLDPALIFLEHPYDGPVMTAL